MILLEKIKIYLKLSKILNSSKKSPFTPLKTPLRPPKKILLNIIPTSIPSKISVFQVTLKSLTVISQNNQRELLHKKIFLTTSRFVANRSPRTLFYVPFFHLFTVLRYQLNVHWMAANVPYVIFQDWNIFRLQESCECALLCVDADWIVIRKWVSKKLELFEGNFAIFNPKIDFLFQIFIDRNFPTRN